MAHAVDATVESESILSEQPAFVPKGEPVVWIWLALLGTPLLLLYLVLSKA
jgi:hypothetical protein